MRIKELRLERNLTQSEVAKAIGTSQRNNLERRLTAAPVSPLLNFIIRKPPAFVNIFFNFSFTPFPELRGRFYFFSVKIPSAFVKRAICSRIRARSSSGNAR